jgi:SAM-dependent methyltransferase
VFSRARHWLAVTADRRLRDLPPGRRLRLRLALAAIEAYSAERGRRVPLRLLDAGSEEGLLCLELARRHRDWTLVAADMSAAPLQRGRCWAAEEGLVVSFVRLDLARSLGRERYDVVVSLECLAEVPDDQAALRSMVTALRPGGLFVAHLPTADWTPVLPGAERAWRREARHGYDPSQLHAMLTGMGLDVRELRPTFRRTTALAQDVRDRLKRRRRAAQMLLLPVMASAVRLERAGLTWGPARALFVTAVKR